MKSIIKFLLGGYRFRIYCGNPSSTAGKLMQKFHGRIYDVKVCEASFTFSCNFYIAKKVIDELKLEGHTVTEISVFGVVKKYRQIRHRPGILIGIAVSVGIIYLQTIPLWDIKVSGNKTVDEKEIISGLSSVGFSVGRSKNSDFLSDYANRLIMNDHRLSRVSINLSGNIAFVEVGERSENNNAESDVSMTGLYATRDSIIELPVVQSGESVVQKGDTVCSGQLLVSPVILGDNNSEYVVGAQGIVLGRIEDVFITVIPYSNIFPLKTGDIKTEKSYSFLGKKLSLDFLNLNFNENYCKNIADRVFIFNRYELPIDILKNNKYEYKPIVTELTYDEAREKAYSLTYKRISSKKASSDILSYEFSEKDCGEYFVLECRVECIENIASPSFE